MPTGSVTDRMPLKINRRRLVLLGCIAVVGVLTGGVLFTRRNTLDALLDTIIPRDEYGPSATEVGLAASVLSASDHNFWRKVELETALVWLNTRAGGNFASCSEHERNNIVSQMAGAGPDSVLWKAYNFVRTICMQQYYADSERAMKLGFVGPPQPEGHPNPEQAWPGSTGE